MRFFRFLTSLICNFILVVRAQAVTTRLQVITGSTDSVSEEFPTGTSGFKTFSVQNSLPVVTENLSDSTGSNSMDPTSPTIYSSCYTSTSSADTLKMHSILCCVLGAYTVTFTLFLLPIPKMPVLELLFISMTAIAGWILLYLDAILRFIRNPKQKTASLLKSFQHGLLNYAIERWYTYQLIRRRAVHTKEHIVINFPPANHQSAPSRFRLGTFWAKDIHNNLTKHNLKDYFDPTDLKLEKYGGSAFTPLKQWSPKASEDDIFSSDEELDASPLATKITTSTMRSPQVRYRRGASVPPMSTLGASNPQFKFELPNWEPLNSGDVSGESKQTCVDETLSPREKVSGFISWNALKRESEEGPPMDGASGDGELRKINTDGSGNSWEKEVLGVGL